MPAILSSVSLNYSQAETELDHFKSWISDNRPFKEHAVVQELRKREHLCLLMSFLGTQGKPNLFKHEFEIQGVFRTDYITGSSHTRHFTLVEFEGGERNALFGPGGTNQMRGWGQQVLHALGQIVDWSWALNDAQHSRTLQNAIGFTEFGRTYVVVCGLDETMDSTEKSRLAWLNDHCTVSDAKVLFMTFDDLVLHFEGQLDIYREAREEARRQLSETNNAGSS